MRVRADTPPYSQSVRTIVVVLAETVSIKLNRRNRRKFEQKAAKETKTDCGRVSVMVIRQGLRRLSGLESSLSSLERFDQSSTEGIEENLNRRQQRKQRRIVVGFL